jgi:hypothetical protein
MTLAFAVMVAVVASSCTYFDPNKTVTSDTSVTGPTVVPTPASHTVEFRVESVLSSGTQQAQITYGTGVDGTSSLQTDLPWNFQVKTTEQNLYVYIQAVSVGALEVRLQVFVDGRLFKEVTGFAPAVSGTIRL